MKEIFALVGDSGEIIALCDSGENAMAFCLEYNKQAGWTPEIQGPLITVSRRKAKSFIADEIRLNREHEEWLKSEGFLNG